MADWWSETELNEGKYIALVVLGTISSTLSLVGSSCIIYMIRKDLATKILNRILLCISISDVVASFSFLLSPYLVPSYLGLPGGSGSHASCSVVGFFWMSSVATVCFYSCYLSVYYWLVVRWSFHERDFKLHWEILAHSVAIIIPVAINAAALATQSLNPVEIVNGVCSHSAIPWGCQGDECIRSSQSTVTILLATLAAFEMAVSLIGFACTFLVWKTVSSAIQRSNAHRFQGDQDEHSDERLQQVSTQAILYSLAYFNTFFWPLMTLCLEIFVPNEMLDAKKDDTGFYVLAVLFYAFYPLQGAMNFFIFSNPKRQQWAKLEPDRSSFWIYANVIQSRQPRRTNRNYTGPTSNASGKPTND